MVLDMNKRKSFVILLISILLSTSFYGCSSSDSTAQTTDSTPNVENTVSTETIDSVETDAESSQEAFGISDESIPESGETDPQNMIPASNENDEGMSSNINSEETVPASPAILGNEETDIVYEESADEDDGVTPTMRNSINMLNYMTSLTQQINEQKGNQLFLETAYNSFDNLFPNSVDIKTQAQITSLMDTVQGYRMISVKRDRLKYIYEQNRAQALRQAIPNPIGLLSAVQSGSTLKIAASVLYMAVDSATSYQAATSQADLQFIKEGWELDDAESNELHESTKNALNYMYDMVRDYDIPGDYALNKGAVDNFVSWSGKPDSQLERKISWFETNQDTYSQFGPYWLEITEA